MTGRTDSAGGETQTGSDPESGSEARAWWAYGGPFALFGVLTMVEGYLPIRAYPLAYLVKVCLVSAALLAGGAARRELVPSARVIIPAVVVGLAVFTLWVGLDRWIPYPHMGSRVAFDPFTALRDRRWAAAFIVVRFYGLVLMVPVMEELFMRSFLLRYFTNPRFREVPMGTYSAGAFGIVAALSAASHPEWLVAALAAAAYGLFLTATRSLFAVVLAHAATNLALGIYVVTTGEWRYW